jgi:hypothetical protein
MNKIESITEHQVNQLVNYRDNWLKIGLTTEPTDFAKAKIAICKTYRLVGLKEPTQFFMTNGPREAIIKIKELDSTQSDNEIVSNFMFGCHDAAWLSYYSYMKEVVGLECCEKLDGLYDLASCCGWLSVYEDVVVFQHPPESIKMDDANRIHCEDGPAIRYRDGTEVYAWHGTRVPKAWIVEKATLTAKTAITWENIEQRRCACEIVGWAKILRELNAKEIDNDGDPEIGTLVEVNIPDIGRERFLRVLCGTKREFAIPVPPEMQTALEAQAWTWGLTPNEFSVPEIRT